ncbi:MAG: MmgE/PrpD family protein [Azospirillum brasilense]|nr:MAG: MmgE/PrpD family protein [Azospirillum brasilense]
MNILHRTRVVDGLARHLARYATGVTLELSARTTDEARMVLTDSLAVAWAALAHEAAAAAARYAALFPVRDGPGCTVWGSTLRTGPETAALANGVLLRCNDYNDLFIGDCNWGHPSDILAAILPVAEWLGLSGERVLGGIALAYEVALALFDTLPATESGWDYSNLTAIAATCAIGRLMELDATRLQEALAITVIPHLASDEIESGDLNRHGDLTMWKRFNAGDAMRQSVYACLLARSGCEGAVRPFVGRLGLLSRLDLPEAATERLMRLLDPARPLSRIGSTTFKRWPVGSRAQSAIDSALDARSRLPQGAATTRIGISTTGSVHRHLVSSRPDPWKPISRETADHSLPFIVAAAILDGNIVPNSFAPDRLADPELRRLISLVEVTADLDAGNTEERQHAADGYLSRVTLGCADGSSVTGCAEPSPGHPLRPFTTSDVETKLGQSMAPYAAPSQIAASLALLRSVEACADICQLTVLLTAHPSRQRTSLSEPSGLSR